MMEKMSLLEACQADKAKVNRHLREHMAKEHAYRRALEEIASYNVAELRSWDEDNAADMVEVARAVLQAAREKTPAEAGA